MEKLIAGNLGYTLGAMARLSSCRSFSFGENAFLLATGTKFYASQGFETLFPIPLYSPPPAISDTSKEALPESPIFGA